MPSSCSIPRRPGGAFRSDRAPKSERSSRSTRPFDCARTGFSAVLADAVALAERPGIADRRGRIHRRAAEGRERAPKGFRRGISSYPSLGNVVFRASNEELAKAYACDSESAIRIGHIQQDSSIPAMVKIDELLGKHFAVLGTTGTGKSCAVALDPAPHSRE